MGLFGRRNARDNPALVGLYGKHPAAGDFLRLNASSGNLRALDEWLSGALAVAQRTTDWGPAYAAGGTLSFLFFNPVRGGGALLGSMAPSSDRSGRLFPLVIFSELELETAVREEAWLPGCSFLDQADGLLRRREGLDREGLLAAAGRIPAPSQAVFEEARERFAPYLEETSCAAAFQGIFLEPGQEERALAALEEVCRGGGGGYAVLCPLGIRPVFDVMLWLRLVQVLSRNKLIPGVLWSDRVLLLFLGKWAPRALLTLWKPGTAEEDFYDLRGVKPNRSRSIPGERMLASWLGSLP